MIYHLLWRYRDAFAHKLGFYAYQDVMFRSVMAVLTSLFIALWVGPKIIRWLMMKKIGDRPEFHHAALNELTKEKANTPTMGGLIIIFATLATTNTEPLLRDERRSTKGALFGLAYPRVRASVLVADLLCTA